MQLYMHNQALHVWSSSLSSSSRLSASKVKFWGRGDWSVDTHTYSFAASADDIWRLRGADLLLGWLSILLNGWHCCIFLTSVGEA